MKRFILSAFLLLTPGLGWTQIPNLHIYYLNGVANSGADNYDAAKALQAALAQLTGNVEVNGIYNPTGSLTGSDPVHGCMVWDASQSRLIPQSMLSNGTVAGSTPAITSKSRLSRDASCVMSDLGELGASKINEEKYKALFEASLIVGNSPQNYPSTMNATANDLVAFYLGNEKPIVAAMAKQVEYAIKRSINSGNKVLLVAHSQGNLIANLAWIRLASSLPQSQLQNVRILNVANTSLFAVHGEDITHNFDEAVFVALPKLGWLHKRNTPSCVGQIELGGTSACAFNVISSTYTSIDRSIGHNFISAYLSETPVTKVANNQTTSFKQAVIDATERLLRSMELLQNQITDAVCEKAFSDVANSNPSARHIQFSVGVTSECKSISCLNTEMDKLKGLGLNVGFNEFSINAGGFSALGFYAPGCVGIRDDIAHAYGFVSSTERSKVETAAKCITKKLGSTYFGPNLLAQSSTDQNGVLIKHASCHGDGFLFPIVIK